MLSMHVWDVRERGVVALPLPPATAPDRRDLLLKEEIPGRRVHSVWDGKMHPAGDALSGGG
ncbi:hypothetical protein [Streptomyces sp. NPDC126514]|uniref:hypothetical protein n=1 Tax=Streptomyces sp. NPDC126514 TaxID=3155210 RepID=UPI00331B6E3A